MNEHDKQTPVTEVPGVETKEQASASAGDSRRRLLKGVALAVPAVLTLRSGRLMAQVSATCQDKLGGAPITDSCAQSLGNT